MGKNTGGADWIANEIANEQWHKGCITYNDPECRSDLRHCDPDQVGYRSGNDMWCKVQVHDTVAADHTTT